MRSTFLLIGFFGLSCSTNGIDLTRSTVTVDRASAVVADGSDTVTVTVTVKNSGGAPMVGKTVALNPTGTGNTVTPASAMTNAQGVVTATLVSTKAEAKTVGVTVSDGSTSLGMLAQQPAVQFVAGPAFSVTFAHQPSDAQAGANLAPAVHVRVQDKNSNGTSDSVLITLASNPSSTMLAGTQTAAAVNGDALFTDLHIDKAATGYTLEATVGTLPSVASNAFDITAGAAAKLGFDKQPVDTPLAYTGLPANLSLITPAPKVAIQDAFGNIVTTAASTTITIAIGSGPGAFTGGSTLTASTTAGIATFSNLELNAIGNYTLSATGGSYTSATSNTLKVLHTVLIGNGGFTYDPATLSINAGEGVFWYWSSLGHNVISGNGSGMTPTPDGKFCSLLDQNCTSTSMMMSTYNMGTTYKHIFTTQGSYPYYCGVHPAIMQGTITAN